MRSRRWVALVLTSGAALALGLAVLAWTLALGSSQGRQEVDLAGDTSLTCGGDAPGMANPAAVHCNELGYRYQRVDTAEGQHAICIFPDGSHCDEWRFLAGECGQSYSYCARHGYGLTTKTDGRNPFSKDYSVCVRGREEIGSVTELMGLRELATRGAFRGEQPASPPKDEPTAPTLPSWFDWRNYNGQNWVTSVKNQGMCGSCWAFSAVGAVEGAYNVGWNDPNLDLDLSEEYLVSDCLSNNSCCGGWHFTALYFIRDRGIPDEACLPYVDGLSTGCSCGDSCDPVCTYRTDNRCSDKTCSDRCANWLSRLRTIDAAGQVSSQSQIKQALIDKGPVSVCLSMAGDFDGQDVFRCTDPPYVTHCVVVVGYNDAGGYWIAKNSWGTGFGDNGYFNVGYGECLIENYVYYAVPPPGSGPYRLTMQVSPSGGGTTTPAEGDHWYDTGTTVPVSASPAAGGWVFHYWSGDCGGSQPSTSVYMDSNKACVANFGCPPVMPGTYAGSVTIDGAPAPDGTTITASIGGLQWASRTTFGDHYAMDVPSPSPQQPPCFQPGQIVFQANGGACTPSPDWGSGLHDNTNLVCISPACTVHASSDVPKPIPDLATITSTVNVGPGFGLTDVNVRLSITHTWDSDLNVFLISPQGTRVELFTRVDGSGDDFLNTVLDDECSTSIASGAAPFAACYRPEGALSAFDGEISSGVWTLEVTDAAGADVGTLQAWSVELCGAWDEQDADGDGWSNGEESHVGTDPLDDCPDDANDDAWPPDIQAGQGCGFHNGLVDILDILCYKPIIFGPYDARYDLDASDTVDILDVLLYKPVIGARCTNP